MNANYNLKQYSNLYSVDSIVAFLDLMSREGAYENAMRLCGSQSVFEDTYLEGSSLEKIKTHYAYLKTLKKHMGLSRVEDIAHIDVFDALFHMSNSNFRFVNNMFVRHFNFSVVKDLYHLCVGLDISKEDFTKRFKAIYVLSYGDDVLESNIGMVTRYIDIFADTLGKYRDSFDWIFRLHTFESVCSVPRKIYLTTKYSKLVSDKYRSKGVDPKASLSFYNSFYMCREEVKAKLFEDVREDFRFYNGAEVMSRGGTLSKFLDILLKYIPLIQYSSAFASDIRNGVPFSTLALTYRLQKYGINSVGDLIKALNNDIIWVRCLLPDDFAQILNSSYDKDGDSCDNIVSVNSEQCPNDCDTKCTLAREVIDGVIFGTLTVDSILDGFVFEDFYSFVRDLVSVRDSMVEGSVRGFVDTFICDLISKHS